MKIRTKEEICSLLDEEIAWRKKELFNLKTLIEKPEKHIGNKTLLTRCGIALLYAHWEGFVKKTGTYFLQYVGTQRLKNNELKENFMSLIVKQHLTNISETKKASRIHCITELFTKQMDKRSVLQFKSAIDTESNLSSKVFREIVWCLGIDYSPYESSDKVFDEQLLAKRNHVAHGEDLDVDVSDYLDLHARILGLMETLRTQLQNAVALESFKRQ